MNESDMASAFEELERNVSLRNQLSKSNHKAANSTGFCLNCGKQLAESEIINAAKENPQVLDNTPRWCDSDCRDDWERENK